MRFGRKTMMGTIGTLVAVAHRPGGDRRGRYRGLESPTATILRDICHSVHPEESAIHEHPAHARVRWLSATWAGFRHCN